MKQSQGLQHEAFHAATKPALNLDRKITGATIGYKVTARGGVLPEKLGRGVWPASQNPYPIYILF